MNIAENPKILCTDNLDILEPAIINVIATISKNTPSEMKTKTPKLNTLKRCNEILPMPYERNERVIIEAPISERIFILVYNVFGNKGNYPFM